MATQTFCPLPWIHQEVRNDGLLRVCAPANTSLQKGICENICGSPYKVSYSQNDLARNASVLKSIRQHMLKGQWHANCVRCQTEEASNLRSRRIVESQLNPTVDVSWAQQRTDETGGIQPSTVPLKSLDIRMGNLCNSKCRMCNPQLSSAWSKDYVELWGKKAAQPKDLDWMSHKANWQSFLDPSSDVEKIHFSGGEPFLIREHEDFLEELIGQKKSQKITLEYITNGTIFPQKLLRWAGHFHRIHIGVSVDGVGRVNDYIRNPARWSLVESNLLKFDQTPKNVVAWLVTTVQAYNILDLPNLIFWIHEKKFEKFGSDPQKPFFVDHPLHSPSFLSTRIFPQHIKEEIAATIRQELETKLQHLPNSLYWKAQQLIETHIQFMFSKDDSSQFTKFLRFTKKLDEIRNEKLSESIPQLGHRVGDMSAALPL